MTPTERDAFAESMGSTFVLDGARGRVFWHGDVVDLVRVVLDRIFSSRVRAAERELVEAARAVAASPWFYQPGQSGEGDANRAHIDRLRDAVRRFDAVRRDMAERDPSICGATRVAEGLVLGAPIASQRVRFVAKCYLAPGHAGDCEGDVGTWKWTPRNG